LGYSLDCHFPVVVVRRCPPSVQRLIRVGNCCKRR
jgi:hypothetical protein